MRHLGTQKHARKYLEATKHQVKGGSKKEVNVQEEEEEEEEEVENVQEEEEEEEEEVENVQEEEEEDRFVLCEECDLQIDCNKDNIHIIYKGEQYNSSEEIVLCTTCFQDNEDDLRQQDYKCDEWEEEEDEDEATEDGDSGDITIDGVIGVNSISPSKTASASGSMIKDRRDRAEAEERVRVMFLEEDRREARERE